MIFQAIPFPIEHLGRDDSPVQRIRIQERGDVPSLSVSVEPEFVPTEVAGTKGLFFQVWAEFQSVVRAERRVTVSVCRLDREVSPSDLLALELESRKALVIHRRDQLLVSGMDSDLLSTHEDPVHGRCISRSMLCKSGEFVFLLEATTSEGDYAGNADALFEMVTSLRVHAEPALFSESISTFEQHAPIGVSFQFPESWRVFRSETGEELCHIGLDNLIDGKAIGRIDVVVSNNQTRNDLLVRFQNLGRSLGLEIPEIQFATMPYGDAEPRSYGMTETQGQSTECLEASVVTFTSQKRQIWIDLLSVPRSTDPFWWAVNKRCFELVASTFGCPLKSS